MNTKKDPVTEQKETLALNLLMEVVNLGRNNRSYKDKLPDLKKALDEAPSISKVVGESLDRTIKGRI